MAPCGTTLATFLWVAPEFCFRVLVQHGLTERITHIAMFFPLTLSHYGSRRHSVRAAVRRQLSERRARSDAPYHVSKFVCHSTWGLPPCNPAKRVTHLTGAPAARGNPNENTAPRPGSL